MGRRFTQIGADKIKKKTENLRLSASSVSNSILLEFSDATYQFQFAKHIFILSLGLVFIGQDARLFEFFAEGLVFQSSYLADERLRVMKRNNIVQKFSSRSQALPPV